MFTVNYADDTLNAAIYIKRAIGTDIPVSYFTMVGSDPLSDGLIDLIQGEGLRTSFRPKLWEDQTTAMNETARMWRITDIGLPSVKDEMNLFGDKTVEEARQHLRCLVVRSGVIKDGENGPAFLGEYTAKPNYAANSRVVDTTGAGDSFNGVFLANIAAGQDEVIAAQAAHNLASKVVVHSGAILPSGAYS